MNKWGFEEAEWQAAKDEARSILIEIAKRRGKIAYSELFPQILSIDLPYDDIRVGYLLGEISREEYAAGRGMLSALVVHKVGDMHPGPGFFDLARELGRDTKDKTICWVNEFNHLYDYWANRHQGIYP